MNSDATIHSGHVRHRPTWMLLAMALPMGIVLNFLSAWSFNRLSGVILALLTGQEELSRFQEGLVGMAVNLGLPTLLVFCLLKFTRLGVWIAPNRLVLGVTMLFDVAIVAMLFRRLYLYGLGQWEHLRLDAQGIIDAALIGCMISALTLLALSTIWNRTDWSGKHHALRLGRWLWREV
jgi:hypothetical protein